MRKITYWILSTLTVLVLLFSYRTSTASKASAAVITQAPTVAAGAGTATAAGTTSSTTSSASSSSTAASSAAPAASAATATSSSTAAAAAPAAAQNVLGAAVDTRFGPVQVQITVENGQITASDVTQVPWSNGKDQQINGRAVPVLNGEVVSAQSSSIDMVSGATYTSEAYIESLQSAIDQANL